MCSLSHLAQELSMTLLRQRMIEDMQVGNLSPHPQATYILHVSLFARHFCKAPELLGPEEIRDYQLYLANQRKLASSSIVVTTGALRFLYNITLKRGWNLEASIPAPRQPKKLPVVLSRAEALHFLGCVEDIKHHAILTTCYAAGLRISEAVRLKTSSLDNQRMVIRVAQGKGHNLTASVIGHSCRLADRRVATRASRESSGKGGDKAPPHRGDRVRDVAFGSDRWRLWVGNPREWQVARAAGGDTVLGGGWRRARGARRPSRRRTRARAG